MSNTGSCSTKNKRKNTPRSRIDPGWEHGTDVDKDSKRVKCKCCGVVRAGGIYRLKHHLAGTHNHVEPCLQVPDDVKQQFREMLDTNTKDSKKKKRKLYDIGEDGYKYEVNSNQRERGKMDAFVSRSRPGMQTTLNQKYKKEERDEVCQQIARFFYTSAISFNAVNNPEFLIMCERIARYGIGFKPPSYHEIRVKFLNKEVTSVMAMLEEFKEEWKKTDCTIMSDGWSDKQRRSICNFLVNSPRGTVFLSSINTSDISKTADKVLEMLDAVVEKVGEENVVQVVTDNAANYKADGEKLMEKRKKLFWTPCSGHCIDLMLEDLDKKIKVHSVTITKARKITTYIYSRGLLHNWMKDFTKGRELITPGVTRFATSYLTLRCLNEQKGSLLALFSSSKWKSSNFVASVKGKKVQRIILDTRGFWKSVISCLKAALPLMKVIRMVDSDESPAMGFIYEAMAQAKNQIKVNFNNVERNYKPILDIVKERWQDQLHRPLHAAAHFLNPQFQYSPDFQANAEVKIGLYNCLQRMIPDPDERLLIDLQMDAFKNARGLFGIPTAVMTRTKKNPADWWDSNGDECPEFKKFAIRILSLTCSSSGCERNWSAFEMVHTKKRNRLHQQKMNDLVFVMYNLKLKRRHEKRVSNSGAQPIVLDDLPSDDEWITEVEEPVLPSDGGWLNSLDRAARRYAREATQGGEENNSIEGENVEVQVLSDDEGEATPGYEDNYDIYEDGDDEGDDDVFMSTTATSSDDAYDGSFGFDN